MNTTLTFSVFQNKLSKKSNILNTKLMAIRLIELDIPFRLVDGVYKHQDSSKSVELSFVTPWTTIYQTGLIDDLKTVYNQESILIVDNNGLAILKFLKDNKLQELGKLDSSKHLPNTDAYTYDAIEDSYFYVKGDN